MLAEPLLRRNRSEGNCPKRSNFNCHFQEVKANPKSCFLEYIPVSPRPESLPVRTYCPWGVTCWKRPSRNRRGIDTCEEKPNALSMRGHAFLPNLRLQRPKKNNLMADCLWNFHKLWGDLIEMRGKRGLFFYNFDTTNFYSCTSMILGKPAIYLEPHRCAARNGHTWVRRMKPWSVMLPVPALGPMSSNSIPVRWELLCWNFDDGTMINLHPR